MHASKAVLLKTFLFTSLFISIVGVWVLSPLVVFAQIGSDAGFTGGGVGAPLPAGITPSVGEQALLGQMNSTLGSVPLTPSFSLAADAMCTPVIPKCPCATVPDGKGGCKPGPNMFQCTCYDVTFGFTTSGVCIAQNKCQALATSDGMFDGMLGMLAKTLGMSAGQMLLSNLMGGGGGTGGTGWSGTGGSGNTGCSTYYQTSDISKLSDPCAQYVAPVSNDIDLGTGSTGGCDPLSAALGQCGAGAGSDSYTCSPLDAALGICGAGTTVDAGTNTNTDTTTNTGTTTSSGGTIRSTIYTQTIKNPDGTYTVIYTTGQGGGATTTGSQRKIMYLPVTSLRGLSQSGERGDILARSSDATVIAGKRDTEKNIETSGFYGAPTFGNQGSQGLVAKWCRARPWSGFLSKVIDPGFFDGICKARGYQVGEPPVAASTAPAPAARAQTPSSQKSFTVPVATTSLPVRATSTPAAQARIDIWAVPPAVPLGTRTSVFWSAQNVVDCRETSSDGQFSHNTLSGGSATVPITAQTTFTITCLVSDGTTVTKSVVVGLKI